MSRSRFAIRIIALGTMLFCLVPPGSASGPAKTSPRVEYVYHSLVPLGALTFSVDPWHSVLTVLASAENSEFEGWRRELQGERTRLVDSTGHPVRLFPDQVDFRVTLGTRTRLVEEIPFPIQTTLPVNDYLLNVRFRLRIFHGLRQTEIPASSVAMVGVPADIPYDERIYRVSFDLDDISTDDRVVLEVLAPGGERLCKFHLDMQ
jgi:hypothetical protein